MFIMQKRASRWKGYAPSGYEVSVDSRAWKHAKEALSEQEQGLLYSPEWWERQVRDVPSSVFWGLPHTRTKTDRPCVKIRHCYGGVVWLGNSNIVVGDQGTVILRLLTHKERDTVDLIDAIMSELRAGIEQWFDEAFDKLREVV